MEEKKLLGRVRTPKRVNFAKEIPRIRGKRVVFPFVHKKLVDVSRRLVQIMIVSLLARRDHQLRLNEPKMTTERSLRA